MRGEIIILLAVSSNIVKAGPLRHRVAHLHYQRVPRFVNETFIPSTTTPETSTSTSSSISIPFSDDRSLASTPISRIELDQLGQQGVSSEQKSAGQRGAGGVAIDPEGARASDALFSVAALTTDTVPSVAPSQIPGVASIASATSNTPAFTVSTGTADDFNTGDRKMRQVQELTLSSFSDRGQSSSQLDSSQSATQAIAETQAAASGSMLLSELTSVRFGSAQSMATPTSAPTFGGTSKVSGQSGDTLSVGTQGSETLTTTSTPSQGTGTADKLGKDESAGTSSSPASDVTPLQGSNQRTDTARTTPIFNSGQNQDDDRTSKAQLTTAQPNLSASPFIIQVPSTLLGDADLPATASSTIPPSLSSQGAIPQFTSPTPTTGNIAMATAFMGDFQSLKPSSSCDPNNADHVSACVHGQLAKCEIDGTYTLQTCGQGEFCYAMPLPNGRNGVDVGCQKPEVYYSAIAAGRVADSSPVPSSQAAKSTLASSTFIDDQEEKVEPAESSPEKVEPTSLPTSTKADSLAQAATISSSTASPGDTTSDADSVFSHFPGPVPAFSEAGETPASSTQTHSPSSSSSPPSSSPIDGSGVVLNFPGNDGPAAGSDTEQRRNPKEDAPLSEDIPPVDQKVNVLGSPQSDPKPGDSEVMDPSSVHVPEASDNRKANDPGITTALTACGNNPNEAITVTVVHTTTVRD